MITLDEANDVAARCALGHECRPFVFVHPDCDLLRVARKLGASDLAVTFGSSYFQRILFADRDNESLAETLGFFCDGRLKMPQFIEFSEVPKPSTPTLSESTRELPEPIPEPSCPSLSVRFLTMALVYATCVILAIKNVDSLMWSDTHAALVRRLTRQNIGADNLLHIEFECLKALNWRLGPKLDTCDL